MRPPVANDNHPIVHMASSFNGAGPWPNMNVLFWLSLRPFATTWMDENHIAAIPMAVDWFDLLMCTVASVILVKAIVHHEGPNSALQQVMQDTRKFKRSSSLSVLSVPVAFAGFSAVAGVLVAAVAGLWLMPERRIERAISQSGVDH